MQIISDHFQRLHVVLYSYTVNIKLSKDLLFKSCFHYKSRFFSVVLFVFVFL